MSAVGDVGYQQEVLGRINRPLSFDTTQTAQKMTPPTIIRCHGNVFTESLAGNDRRLHIQTHRLMGGVYEVRR
jgi:hypothetical protein